MPTPKGKKFTVSEFQTWLDGIMEFQESGWSPSPEQWKAIYQKIQNLKEPPQSPKKVTIDDSSIEEIVDEVSRVVPDLGGVDFDLLMNLVNAIANQMRQGATVPPQQQYPAGASGDNPRSDQHSTVQMRPPVQGDELANIPLSELRKQQGQLPSGSRPQGSQENIIEDVEDEFV